MEKWPFHPPKKTQTLAALFICPWACSADRAASQYFAAIRRTSSWCRLFARAEFAEVTKGSNGKTIGN
jgi:hypothetical protein